MKQSKSQVLKLVYAAVCLALAMVLPLLTGQIQSIGSKLCPMHIPVLLCGFLCGPIYGAAVGFIAPLLRFAIFGMPPIMPTGLAMAFELMTYGLLAGLLYKLFAKKTLFIYVTLILSMIGGRIIWGIAMLVITGITGAGFTFAAFISGALLNAIPGIIIQIILIPVIVIALKKARLMD